MEPELVKELRQYAWAYFDRHAEQRLKTFNFYLVLCGAIIAGLISRKPSELPNYSSLLFLLSFVSFIFWKLDVRNRDLTKHSEEALKLLEDELSLPDESGVPHRCKLFRREENDFSKLKRFPKSTYFSYTTCFRFIFALFGFGGFILGILGTHLGVQISTLFNHATLTLLGVVLSLCGGWVLTYKATEFQHENDPLAKGAYTPGRIRVGWRGVGWALLVAGTFLSALPTLLTIL
jgi:hypothetical protein